MTNQSTKQQDLDVYQRLKNHLEAVIRSYQSIHDNLTATGGERLRRHERMMIYASYSPVVDEMAEDLKSSIAAGRLEHAEDIQKHVVDLLDFLRKL